MFTVFSLICIGKYIDQIGIPIVCLFNFLVEVVEVDL